MRKARLARPLTVLTAGAIFAFMSPAWADTTININSGNVPTTAQAHSDHECSANLGGGPFAGQDVWVFNLPSQGGNAGVFVSVTAIFDTPDGVQTKTIPADGGGIVHSGHSKAWIAVDAGWTLTAASAVITGTADKFVLTHTCPATPGGTPSPSPSSPGSPNPTPTPSPSASADPSSPPTDPSSPPSSGGPSPSSSASQSPLPRTGAAITSMLAAGGIVTAAGGVLVWLMRRRRATLTHLED